MRSGVIGFILGLLLMPLMDFACAPRPLDESEAILNYPATSPSGEYRLVVMEGFDGQSHFAKFDIVSNERPWRALFTCKQHFRPRDTTFFVWDQSDRVWVYSGDIGTFYWEREKGGTWEEHIYGSGGAPAPAFLKQQRPRRFTR
jgi:hypothetical protein